MNRWSGYLRLTPGGDWPQLLFRIELPKDSTTMVYRKILVFLLVFVVVSAAQKTTKEKKGKPPAAAPATAKTADEDISGMYSFLKEGEFVQINLDQGAISGYISREGELESDRGEFLDQFFTKASIQGHEISFTTKAIHGIWFEFKGRFDRGPAKTKAEDAYYLLHGTLTQYTTDAENKATSRSREVEFKWLAQPDETQAQL